MTGPKDMTPVRLLIAAMGGEGGGVLAGWLTEAAMDAGLWVQRTSVPGVAQRTGATTYYLEFLPRTGPQRPVMSLHPAPGRVDVMVATELLEAVRMVRAGFVTRDRTLLIASTHRTFTVDEKSAMSDGRLDPEPMITTCRDLAKTSLIHDLSKVAAEHSCHLNSVVMGLIAGSGALPLPEESCRKAVQSGKQASASNLRGFDAGLALAHARAEVPNLRGSKTALPGTKPILAASTETAFLPPEAAGFAAEGMRRLTDFQDADYAQSYLGHMRRISQHKAASPEMLSALARHMAVRMSYEDTHRVAQLKLREVRLSRVRAEAKARDGDIVDVAEYMKPGPEEIFGMFPKALGARLTAWVARKGWASKSFPMKVRTTRFSGFIRLRMLAAARRWRLRSLRHWEEMAWLSAWLDHIERALDIAPDAALQVVETAQLVRGYGATFKRGLSNWHAIERDIILPCLEGRLPPDMLADAVLQARLAAVKDPDGTALSKTIASFLEIVGAGSSPKRPAAQ